MKQLRILTIATCAMLSCMLVLSPLAGVRAAASEPVRVAVFDFELIDTSLQGEVRGKDDDETARLAMLAEHLRQHVAAAPGVVLADVGPVLDRAADRKLHACVGCAIKLAAEIGADLAVTGTVQKVSNLILNINVSVQDVVTGKTVQRASADIRGNTDDSWLRGLQWLIKNRLRFTPDTSGTSE
jgi:hypothetical protein